MYHCCANNPDLKYGQKTSSSALTKDLFSRINIFTKKRRRESYVQSITTLYPESGKIGVRYKGV